MNLTKKQQKVCDLVKYSGKPVIWLGAIRSGKTWGACWHILEEATSNSGTYVFSGFTYGSVERNILPVISQMLNELNVKNFTLKKSYPYRLDIEDTGSIIYFMGASDEAAYKPLQGLTITGAVVDECLLIPKSFIMQLVARMSEDSPWLLMTANKEGPNNWLKRDWIDTKKAIVVESTLDDNEYITDNVKCWYDDLIVGHFRDNMLNNDWKAMHNHICYRRAILWDGGAIEAATCHRGVNVIYTDLSDEEIALFISVLSSGQMLVTTDHNNKFPVLRNKYSNRVDKIPALDIANALSLCEIVSDSEVIVNCLNALVWEGRDKPCHLPPAAMAVGMGVKFCGGSMGILMKPEHL